VYRGAAEFAAFPKVYTQAARIGELVNDFRLVMENPVFSEHPLMCSISAALPREGMTISGPERWQSQRAWFRNKWRSRSGTMAQKEKRAQAAKR